jgi:hypothetical protein
MANVEIFLIVSVCVLAPVLLGLCLLIIAYFGHPDDKVPPHAHASRGRRSRPRASRAERGLGAQDSHGAVRLVC